jgi:hypothetical protein
MIHFFKVGLITFHFMFALSSRRHGCFAPGLVKHSLRFNCSSLLSQGSMFFELIQKIRAILTNTLIVKYDPPAAQFPLASGFC